MTGAGARAASGGSWQWQGEQVVGAGFPISNSATYLRSRPRIVKRYWYLRYLHDSYTIEIST